MEAFSQSEIANLEKALEMSQNLKASQMIDLLTAEKCVDLNQVFAMEISDKMKGSLKESKEGCRKILLILKTNNSKRILLCLELVEVCSKNGNLNFHRFLGTKGFAE
mmetsp:Transcript_34586/g.52912  ORF Transcript_34586/g.52912 Transcript_34586/m.52912 type:complete len:107 (+) Transcript_34586:39-359(+)